MDRLFGTEFSSVRIKELKGAPGVLGTAVENDLQLPASGASRHLLAHELTHVVQQRRGLYASRQPDSTRTLEAEAERAADASLAGAAIRIAGFAKPGAPQHSDLADTIRDAKDKGAVFDALRAASARDRKAVDVIGRLVSRFAGQQDDMWLAERLVQYGPEPLWPADELSNRASHKWPAEPGNIAAGIEDPDRDPDPKARHIDPIKAYLFPGTDPGLRVLVIGGVHGSEPEGHEVVDRLRQRLAAESAAGHPPSATTILVPELIVETSHKYLTRPEKRFRYVKDRNARPSGGLVEPNRNFPFPGVSYQEARALGAGGKPELLTLPIKKGTKGEPEYGAARRPPDVSKEYTTVRMLPETRALIHLLETFKPTRIVSVHAHDPGKKVGDAPGVFVDLRGTNPRTGAVDLPDPKAAAAAQAEDLDLTGRLLSAAQRRVGRRGGRREAFTGNAPLPGATTPNLIYATSAHAEGTSLGMYGPVKTSARPAATTITVEVPALDPRKERKDLDEVVTAHAEAIDEVILR